MMGRRVIALALLGALCLSACVEDPVPTGVNASTAPDLAPQILTFDAQPASNNQFVLRAQAQDPSLSPLTFTWTKSGGDLSTVTGPSTLWRAPKEGGAYTVTLEVSNGKGLKTTATQRFQVNGEEVSADGDAQVTPGTGGGTPQTGSGRFTLPTPVPFATPSLLLVGGNPSAPTPVPPSPSPPFTQPVATPVPGAPTPTPPPQQPISTPTPNNATPTPLPTPIPTDRPNPPLPGVPAPAPGTWVQVPPVNIPTAETFTGISFVDDGTGNFAEGWVVGTSGAVLRSTDGGVSWQYRNNGVPAGARILDVKFVSPGVGFICGASALLMRTTDGGANWQSIWPTPANPDTQVFNQIVIVNQQIFQVSTTDGRVMRSENGNAATAGGVSFTQIDTKPIGRPNDQAQFITAGGTFATNVNAAYFASDGIYRMEKGANPEWQRQLQLGVSEGFGTAVFLTTPNEVWIGTDRGFLFHSLNAGGAWERTSTYFNREHNGGQRFLDPVAITAIDFPTETRGFVAMGARMRDTFDRGATWKETVMPGSVSDMQMQRRVVGGTEAFFGWAAGPGGVIMRYLPNN